MASPAVGGEALTGLASGASSLGRQSYAKIIAESKPPPPVPGIKPPAFTDSGEPTVYFTREEVGKSILTLNLAVIVRCAYGRSSIPDIKSCLSQRLEFREDFIVSILNHRHLLLRFEDKEDFLKVILRRSLCIKRLLYIFLKWDAKFDFSADPTIMPIGVGFPLLHVNYYYPDFLRSIAGNLGQVLRIYEPTSAITQTQEAFVCVELDIAKARPKRIWIGCGQEGFWQKNSYYKVVAVCSFCHKLGHAELECNKKTKDSVVMGNPQRQQTDQERKLDDNVTVKKSWHHKEVREVNIAPLMVNSFAPLMDSDPSVEAASITVQSEGLSEGAHGTGPQGDQEEAVQIQPTLHGVHGNIMEVHLHGLDATTVTVRDPELVFWEPSSSGFIAEGHSINRPPFFNGTDYSYWKNRMQVFLRAQNYEIWKVVEVGPYENQGDEETWTREQIRRATLNYSAMNMIQCAVHPKEYSRISMCKSAKEMWDKLELLYEGTSQVKETKANILVSEYELFMMKSDETISEMFAMFMIIVNGLKALGKDYTDADLAAGPFGVNPQAVEVVLASNPGRQH
ncbi:hypothetical protein Taro_005797 [Colocasia esculenta]|uniref:DUF4283 domain-containing protein n=1 Tax=Colocasia esculenta TaxID=4460 RepID=A0A843TQT1_COLES|nr:hypothetical protein [Colocasia esculenta]